MIGLFALAALGSALPRKPAKGDFSPPCIFCKSTIMMVKMYLEDKKSVHEIALKLEQYCKYVAEDVRPLCIQIVEEKVQMIVDMILKEMEDHNICVILGQCKD